MNSSDPGNAHSVTVGGTASGGAGYLSTGFGYQCSGCGTWVANGTYHQCFNKTYPATSPTYPTYTPTTQYVYVTQPIDFKPLLDKLDEVLKALEKIREEI